MGLCAGSQAHPWLLSCGISGLDILTSSFCGAIKYQSVPSIERLRLIPPASGSRIIGASFPMWLECEWLGWLPYVVLLSLSFPSAAWGLLATTAPFPSLFCWTTFPCSSLRLKYISSTAEPHSQVLHWNGSTGNRYWSAL